MIFSCEWLRDFVDLDLVQLSPAEWARELSMMGFAVEGMETADRDLVLDLDITTNRPDCLNHLGLAREIAAHFGLKLKQPDCSPPEASGPELPARVTIEDGELCPRYACRVLTDIQITTSPDWLKRRLESIGQRAVNNIVDITNYVLFELGQPLHAFDYDNLSENRIVVRRAVQGERLVTLDGLLRELDPSMLAICDAEQPVALAGIVGGEQSAVSSDTARVLLESAYFDPPATRRTVKGLAMRTEASYRFERGADPEMPVRALNRACRLMAAIMGATCSGPPIDEYPQPVTRPTIVLRSSRIHQLLGHSPDRQFSQQILSRLEFNVGQEEKDVWQVEVPSFRTDVELEEDLVEELARHLGYDQIASTYPPASQIARFLPTRDYDLLLTRALVGMGFFEAVSYVFRNPQRDVDFWGEPVPMIPIANPLTAEHTHLRTSLLPGLLEAVQRNLNRGNHEVRLFELGKIFLPGPSGGVEDFREANRLALTATGEFYRPFWSDRGDDFLFFHLKGIVNELMQRVGLKVEFGRDTQVSFLHPGMAAKMTFGGEKVGVLGLLHPRLTQALKLRREVLVAEANVDLIYERPFPEPRFQPFARFPAVERDLSFVLDKQTEYDKIEKLVKSLSIGELQGIRLIDLYSGSGLPKQKIGVTVRLTFASEERTLTQEEVAPHCDRIFSVLHSTLKAVPRSLGGGP